MLRLVLAWLHLIALGVGLGAVWARARALSAAPPGAPPDGAALRRAFLADTAWGISAGLWIATGLWRLFGETEKAVGYYMASHVFWAKMGMVLLVLALEAWPMATLIRWRVAIGRGTAAPATAAAARRVATVSYVEAGVVALIVAAAVAMARGYGSRG